jgi:maltose/moltooligosaccharide transporter
MATKARLNIFQIWNMCFGFFGIQIGFGLQNANTSRIFQGLGVEVNHLAILWIAAPATGLLVQPVIGYLSDKTWGRLGRRRPYFFWGAILTSAALLVMPNAPVLWIAAAALWVMDASINITMEPFRAFVGDNLPDEQRASGYAMQSFFIGTGAVLASALPWILTNGFSVSNVAADGGVPPAVHIAFYAGAAGLLLSVLWTVFTTREYSPEQLAAFGASERALKGEALAADTPTRTVRAYMVGGVAWTLAGAALAVAIFATRLEKEVYVLAGMIGLFGLAQIVAGLLRRAERTANGFSEVVEDLFRMPATMKQLAVVQFFSWFGLFAMWIYTTPAVTAFHYHAADTATRAYNDGADWVGVLFALYNGVAALAALVIPLIARAFGRKASHALCLGLGGLGLAQVGAGLLRRAGRTANGFSEVVEDLFRMPATMKQLAVVQFFSWFGLFAMWIYTTPAVAAFHYHAADTASRAYNDGADWVGVLFAIYNGVAALAALVIPLVARAVGRKACHALCLGLGGLGLAAFPLIREPGLLWIPMIGVGFAWSSILSAPYSILSGALPAAVLALLVDGVLGLVERLLAPAHRRGRRAKRYIGDS